VALAGKRHIAPKEVFPFEYLENESDRPKEPDFKNVEKFLSDVKGKNQNFCLYMMFPSPHGPWTEGDRSQFDLDKIQLPPVLADTPGTRENYMNYLAEVNYLDSQINAIMNLLRKKGMAENTMIFVSTEQGNAFPFAKWTLYNAGVTSGLIINWPSVIEPGIETDALVEFSDILPTMIDAAGGTAVENLDGFSMMPLLRQKTNEHKEYTYSIQTTRTINAGSEYFPSRAVSNGEYRLILNLASEVKFKNLVTEEEEYFKEWWNSTDAKYQKMAWDYENRPPAELYHEIKDPYNRNNLIEHEDLHPIVKELKAKLTEWMAYCGDDGITTELTAREHTTKKMHVNKVDIVSEFSLSQKNGDFSVHKDGYYFFYSDTDQTIKIDGIALKFGQQSGGGYSDYAVIALKEGKHTLENKYDVKLTWSGPDMNRTDLVVAD
jgi:uncharacterized sulfatase